MALTTTQYDEIMHTYYANHTATRAMEQERKQIIGTWGCYSYHKRKKC